MIPFLNAEARAVAREWELRIPGPAGNIRALLFAPENTAGEALPVLVYLHGGGWVILSPESHVKLTKLAVGAGLIVVSIDYRLAPENPYPAPLDDWVAAFRWVRENAASLGGDQARVSIGGDSAGGSLAATTTLRLLAEGGKPPNSVLMICPSADLAMQTDSIRTLSPDDPIPGNALHGILPRLLRAGRWEVERPVSPPTCRRPFGFPSYLRRRRWHRPSPR